jgi:hypothetical protein
MSTYIITVLFYSCTRKFINFPVEENCTKSSVNASDSAYTIDRIDRSQIPNKIGVEKQLKSVSHGAR